MASTQIPINQSPLHTPSMGMVVQSICSLAVAVTLADTIRESFHVTKHKSVATQLIIRYIVCAILFVLALIIISKYPLIDAWIDKKLGAI